MKKRVPAVEGFFTLDDKAPRLIGSQCAVCKTYYFPAETLACRNPNCAGGELKSVELSPRGKLWSYTNASYQPPAPFVAPDPFKPFAIAAVELEKEKLIVLGQVADHIPVEKLRVGMELELALSVLHADADKEYLTWQWKPVAS